MGWELWGFPSFKASALSASSDLESYNGKVMVVVAMESSPRRQFSSYKAPVTSSPGSPTIFPIRNLDFYHGFIMPRVIRQNRGPQAPQGPQPHPLRSDDRSYWHVLGDGVLHLSGPLTMIIHL